MTRIYNIHIYNDIDSNYICYHNDKINKHLYLVNIDKDYDNTHYRFVRINYSEKNKKLIEDFDIEHTYDNQIMIP